MGIIGMYGYNDNELRLRNRDYRGLKTSAAIKVWGIIISVRILGERK